MPSSRKSEALAADQMWLPAPPAAPVAAEPTLPGPWPPVGLAAHGSPRPAPHPLQRSGGSSEATRLGPHVSRVTYRGRTSGPAPEARLQMGR
jgi:hypothetical protein